jgi:DNA-binding response OmpR family regulator
LSFGQPVLRYVPLGGLTHAKGRPCTSSGAFRRLQADFRAGELRKQGVKIKLQKQPFEVLEMLLEHPHVSREELRKRIWPVDTFVDFDQGLSNAIKRLREALCESADSPRACLPHQRF